MQSSVISWNPNVSSQFLSYAGGGRNGGKLQLLQIVDTKSDIPQTTPNRELRTLRSWEISQLTCLSWRSLDREGKAVPILAYGTGIGSVHLLNSSTGEERSVLQPSKLGKRPCNALSWNYHLPSQLVAGFENLKSEFCTIVWDFEHEYFLKTSFGESACSISWLPDSLSTFVLGTSMGWVKVYDTRTSNQQGPVCSVNAHTAARPRKVGGIRPDPHHPNMFATFSELSGDAVKVWDLRRMTHVNSGNSNSGNNTASSSSSGSSSSSSSSSKTSSSAGASSYPVCSISPSYGGASSSSSSSSGGGGGASASATSASSSRTVADIAWCPTRPDVLAVAISGQNNVYFYSTSSSSSSTGSGSSRSGVSGGVSASSSSVSSTSSMVTSVPICVMRAEEPVKTMSWQGTALRMQCTVQYMQQQQQQQQSY
eukprot:CAMPEP_0175000242 /NCGR_PEP_ID=MMETSP0005-20121125/2486_1 /TAXON_ID=420556 /ORGANISM="Ochromonas sp., Strain CCMP1393" /LENGTH=424 /DNA_ID=CAMNT_0016255029 /DNA_START=78 /DNA_END=1349 /DNA_ORIENTATION=+